MALPMIRRPINPFVAGNLMQGAPTWPMLMQGAPLAQGPPRLPQRPMVLQPMPQQEQPLQSPSAPPDALAAMAGSRGGGLGGLGGDLGLAFASGVLGGGTTEEALGRGFAAALGSRTKGALTTDDMREYALAKRQGFPGSFVDYQTTLRQAGTPKVPAGENAYDKALNEGLAKTMMGVSDAAAKATSQLVTVKRMRQLANDPTFYSGAAGDMVLKGKQVLAAVSGDPNVARSGEDFRALSNKLVFDRLGSLGNQISNSDRTFIENMVPNINMTPAGINGLLDIYEKLSERDLEMLDLANRYATERGGRIDSGWNTFMGRWANEHPLFAEASGGGSDIDALVKKYAP